MLIKLCTKLLGNNLPFESARMKLILREFLALNTSSKSLKIFLLLSIDIVGLILSAIGSLAISSSVTSPLSNCNFGKIPSLDPSMYICAYVEMYEELKSAINKLLLLIGGRLMLVVSK